MLCGKTKSGFEFQIDENKLRSKRFVKLAIKLNKAAKAVNSDEDAKESAAAIMLAEDEYEVFILGEDQQEKLISHCDAKAGGYATSEDIQNEVNEIVEIVAEKSSAIKNS